MNYEDTRLLEVLTFWFEELSLKDWFEGGKALDATITTRFLGLHAEVAAGEYWKYRGGGKSLLAEVIVLDQFSRQIFRDTASAFAYDGIALVLAQQAIMQGYDTDLTDAERQFLYMPFMHSESRTIHIEAIKLFESLGNAEVLKYEQIHKDIIDQFGRYPHRNEVLGRESTPEETEYLENTQENFF